MLLAETTALCLSLCCELKVPGNCRVIVFTFYASVNKAVRENTYSTM